MNKLRRAVEKKKPSQPPAEKTKKDNPKEKAPGQDEFKRAVNALWGRAFLELTSSFERAKGADEGETWE